VQAKLDENRQARGLKNERSEALLLGKLYDDRGNRMTPSFAIKKGVRYRYYVSCVLAQGRKSEAGTISRIASDAIDAFVLAALAGLKKTNGNGEHVWPANSESISLADWRNNIDVNAVSGKKRPPEMDADPEGALVESFVERIILGAEAVEIQLRESADASARSPAVRIPWSPRTFRRKRELLPSTETSGNSARPIRVEARSKLLAAIAKGRRWLQDLTSGEIANIESIAAQEGVSERSARMTLSLAFLAPDLVQAAVDGTLPRGFGVSRLTDLPADWAKQRQALGLATAP
jgi:site-specific DNA recombinase